MRKYETIVIFSAKMNDSEVENESQKFQDFLKKNGATDVAHDTWGKRELAYQLENGSTHGIYMVYYYEAPTISSGDADANIVESINKSLRINENVLKFQTHKISESQRKFKGRISTSPEAEAAAKAEGAAA